MKKLICLITALMMFMMVTVPAFAAEDDFVPSIEIKDGPEVEDAVIGGENVGSSMVITSVLQAQDQSTGITQEEREHLLNVYNGVLNNEIKAPNAGDNYVIQNMVDVSFIGGNYEEEIEQGNSTVTITFNLGVHPATNVAVYVYDNGEWIDAISVVNNGDGTVTVVLDRLGVVSFCVDADAETAPPATGDLAMGDIALWGGMLMVSGVMLVCVVLMRRKASAK